MLLACIKNALFFKAVFFKIFILYIYIYTTLQAFWQSSAPGALSSLVASVVLYSLTRATLTSPGKDETCVCGHIRSEFIHWALWRTLMRIEYSLFVHRTTSILAKLSTWCFEHSLSGDISCSLLVKPEPHWQSRKTLSSVRIVSLLKIYSPY